MNILSALPIVCLVIALPYCEPADGVILLHCRRKEQLPVSENLECEVHGVTIKKPHKYEFKVACPHHSAHDKVKWLRFTRCQVEFLPKSLFNAFRYAERAEISHVLLEHIHPEAFHYAKSLAYLDVSHNRIREIGLELSGASSLVYLDLSHNLIEVIQPETFEGLRSLKILILEANSLVSFSSVDRSFHELDLHLNHLNVVCANATILNLNSNRIKSFSACPSHVHELRLANNLLNSFDTKQLTRLQGLKTLDLSRNGLKQICFNQLPYSLHLQHLNLSRCQLTQMTLGNLHYLRILDVSFNPRVSSSELKHLKHLTELHVKGMKLTLNDFEALRDSLGNLRHLHILSDWTCEYLDQIVDVFCKTNVTVHFGRSCTDDVVIHMDDASIPRLRSAFADQLWVYVLLLFGILVSGTLAYVVLQKVFLSRLQYY